MSKIQSDRIRKELKERIKSHRKRYIEERRINRLSYFDAVRLMRANLIRVEISVANLAHLNLSWWGSDLVYIPLSGETKAEFSDWIRKIASALNEAPDIRLGEGHSEYMADFKDSRVHVYMRDPKDCQLIEVEEVITRKVLRPHPRCKAALAELEEVV